MDIPEYTGMPSGVGAGVTSLPPDVEVELSDKKDVDVDKALNNGGLFARWGLAFYCEVSFTN